MIKLRPSKVSETKLIANIDKQVNLTYWTYEELKTSLAYAHNHAYIVEDSTKVIGFIVFSVLDDEAEILQFCILTEYQGRSYGTMALNLLCDILKYKFNINNIFLEVRDNNQVAINLYKKCDFTITHTRKNYYKIDNWYVDALLMHKIIKP